MSETANPYSVIKRSFDIVCACIGLAITAPLMLLVAAMIGSTMGLPVFFRQLRPGRAGRPFRIIKFRTMADLPGEPNRPHTDAKRLTVVGRWLRRASLDELPELINVLKGDMSLVGPRPLLIEYVERYTPEQARRQEVKPGITGWAQVNGRNALAWEKRFELDVWYVDNRSFWLDLKILWLTLIKVMRREGVSAENHATMPEFTGNNSGTGT